MVVAFHEGDVELVEGPLHQLIATHGVHDQRLQLVTSHVEQGLDGLLPASRWT